MDGPRLKPAVNVDFRNVTDASASMNTVTMVIDLASDFDLCDNVLMILGFVAAIDFLPAERLKHVRERFSAPSSLKALSIARDRGVFVDGECK